jgi:hypothetical protein
VFFEKRGEKLVDFFPVLTIVDILMMLIKSALQKLRRNSIKTKKQDCDTGYSRGTCTPMFIAALFTIAKL